MHIRKHINNPLAARVDHKATTTTRITQQRETSNERLS